ncbi:MAG: DUF5684 domain-containing protein [Oscillospiraceae bacterium]|nr:DUF5684 domain-containing protein [Oscillospiraceae bacterium]
MYIIEKIFPEFAGQPWAVIITGLSVAAAIWILQIISWWKVFRKMGEPGWKCIIPFYGEYILFSRCYSVKRYWEYLVCDLVLWIFQFEYFINIQGVVWEIILGIVAVILCIWYIIIEVRLTQKISYAFGHGVAFGLGIYFFNFIFMLILGFGKSKYLGNQVPYGKHLES